MDDASLDRCEHGDRPRSNLSEVWATDSPGSVGGPASSFDLAAGSDSGRGKPRHARIFLGSYARERGSRVGAESEMLLQRKGVMARYAV